MIYFGRECFCQKYGNIPVSIELIAKNLSQICMYAGATPEFYSVAEHSIFVSSIVDSGLAKFALLHDAHEAFIGDIIAPVVEHIGLEQELCGLKKRLDVQIYGEFMSVLEQGSDYDSESIKQADKLARDCEMFHFFDCGEHWPMPVRRMMRDMAPKFMSCKLAEAEFLRAWDPEAITCGYSCECDSHHFCSLRRGHGGDHVFECERRES